MKKDENGVMRHTWDKERLDAFYKELCNYIADCEMDEYRGLEPAFNAIKISVHQQLLNQ